jgi:hypothetical protein
MIMVHVAEIDHDHGGAAATAREHRRDLMITVTRPTQKPEEPIVR